MQSGGRGEVLSVIILMLRPPKINSSILNPTPLECITAYIMYNVVGERSLKSLPQRRLNFIDCSIYSYCSILNSPERLEHIRQANKLASVLCDLEYD